MEIRMLRSDKRLFRLLVSRADAARDAKRFEAAAVIYEEALTLAPNNAAVHVQRGHMLKESGRLNAAEEHYRAAERLRPEDADLALQFGHLYKLAERLGEARAAYQRALVLRPGWHDPERELAGLAERINTPRAMPLDPADVARELGRSPDALGGRSAAELQDLVPALAPRRPEDVLIEHREEIAVRRLGRRESTFWGNRPVLRGAEAVRGFYVAERPILEAHVILDGIRIYRGPLKGGYVLPAERDRQRIRKYVFNFWIDFSAFMPGLHQIELHFFDAAERRDIVREEVVIAEPAAEEAYPDSNFVVSVSPDDPRSVEEQIRSRPSMVRQAKRALFPNGVRNVLVIRCDQLGDMVASIPALLRMREMMPEARLVGLFNGANAELARTLNVLDEIIVINFPDDPLERRRLMTLDDQAALRDRLKPYAFDIAIDLAQAAASRDLLRLTGATFTFGTGGEDWPWLSSDFLFHTRDRWTRHDFTPHSTKVLGLVESLGALLKTSATIIRRSDLSQAVLEEYGIGPEERFAVLHTGARIGFSRWPHYGELARMLLSRTDLKIVIITEDPSFRQTMPADVLANPRLVYLDRRLPFDHFDAFLSFATAMAGNDSGPKHLASLRGTNVVTIFSARINWTEWGQENVGVVISRKLPCAGCALLHDPEECGHDFACITDIRAQEVFDAMNVYIAQAPKVSA
jgi:ADP-heptose:LPS heptosyltransferase